MTECTALPAKASLSSFTNPEETFEVQEANSHTPIPKDFDYLRLRLDQVLSSLMTVELILQDIGNISHLQYTFNSSIYISFFRLYSCSFNCICPINYSYQYLFLYSIYMSDYYQQFIGTKLLFSMFIFRKIGYYNNVSYPKPQTPYIKSRDLVPRLFVSFLLELFRGNHPAPLIFISNPIHESRVPLRRLNPIPAH